MSSLSAKMAYVLLLCMVSGAVLLLPACLGASSDSDDEWEDNNENDDDDDGHGSDGDDSSDGDNNADGDTSDGDDAIDGDGISDGDENSDGDESADGDEIADGDDTEDADESPDGDGAPDGDGEMSPPDISGYVSLWETEMLVDYKGSASSSVSISASFVENDPQSSGQPIEAGECLIYPYNSSTNQPTVLDAGRITVTGSVISPVYSDCGNGPKGDGRCIYYFGDVYQLSNLFDAGDAISVQIAGKGRIPAFSLSAGAPSELANLSPDIMSPSYSYQAGSPLAFTWTAGDGMVQISVQAYVYSNYQIVSGYSVLCLTADDGSFALPSEALDYLPASSNYTGISISRQSMDGKRNGDVEARLSIGTQKTRVWSYVN